MATKRVAKIYQCDKPGYNLAIDQNDNPWLQDENDERVINAAAVIAFHPVPEPLTGTVFGEVASDNPVTLARIQIVTTRDPDGKVKGTRNATPEEVENIIENSKAFKNCIDHKTIGVRGIWLKSERQKQLQQEVGIPGGVTASSIYEKMNDAVLQLHIETEGGKYPIKGEAEDEKAYHAKLVQIAVELEAKK